MSKNENKKVEEVDEEEEETQVKLAKGERGQEAKQLGSLGAGGEEHEVEAKAFDPKLISGLVSGQSAVDTKKAERERELAAIKLAPADVELVAQQMDVEKAVAERALRENKGDVAATLLHMTTSFPALQKAIRV
eukprot:GDKI01027384.1.p2 GENE.GDKI01027384.1~~GDKI01027384.1.p2  ORF type:complete len:146 (+),score=48.02 GDKI01027384.1:37-438(+)